MPPWRPALACIAALGVTSGGCALVPRAEGVLPPDRVRRSLEAELRVSFRRVKDAESWGTTDVAGAYESSTGRSPVFVLVFTDPQATAQILPEGRTPSNVTAIRRRNVVVLYAGRDPARTRDVQRALAMAARS